MDKEWFKACEFIKQGMTFYSYRDFYNHKRIYKRNYNLMNDKEKQLYKWYVYARREIPLNLINEIWDYLNDYKTEEFMTTPRMIEERKNARNNKQTKISN